VAKERVTLVVDLLDNTQFPVTDMKAFALKLDLSRRCSSRVLTGDELEIFAPEAAPLLFEGPTPLLETWKELKYSSPEIPSLWNATSAGRLNAAQ
jgi:hypothetical protein